MVVVEPGIQATAPGSKYGPSKRFAMSILGPSSVILGGSGDGGPLGGGGGVVGGASGVLGARGGGGRGDGDGGGSAGGSIAAATVTVVAALMYIAPCDIKPFKTLADVSTGAYCTGTSTSVATAPPAPVSAVK